MNKYLIVSDTSQINGGAAKVAIDTAVGLAKKGNEVVFFAGGGVNDDSLINKNIKIINLGMKDLLSGGKLKMFFKGIYNKEAKKKFDEFLDSINLDEYIVHVHSWVKCLSPSIFDSLKKRNKHFYITAHDYFLICPNGGLFNYKKNTICDNKKGCSCLFTNCDSRKYLYKIWRYKKYKKQCKILKKCDYTIISISKLMTNLFSNYNKNKIEISNPINLNKKEYEEINEKPKYFYYVGRLSKEKGLTYFCEAIIKSGYKCKIFGSGPIEKELIEKYSCDDIEFMGWKKMNEIYPTLKDCLALVFPSVWYEGAPLTIPEIQSYGVPCIVSNACSGIDYIENGKNGLVFESKNVDSLIECMAKIDSLSTDEYKAMREFTYEYAHNSNNSVDKYTKELLEKMR